MDKTLRHYGVKGMKWGVRKKRDPVDYKRDRVILKKGTEIKRISTVERETHKGSGYASFLDKDKKGYEDTAAMFSKLGMKHYSLTFKAKKALVSPSERERVDVFLKKMKDPVFEKSLRSQQRRMFLLNLVTPNDIKLTLRNEKLDIGKARAYRMLNFAIAANKKLRADYLGEFKKLGYDFILDEADSSNKVSEAPIIFLDRADSLEFISSRKL